jgi:hypothetical protein
VTVVRLRAEDDVQGKTEDLVHDISKLAEAEEEEQSAIAAMEQQTRDAKRVIAEQPISKAEQTKMTAKLCALSSFCLHCSAVMHS